MAVVVSIAGPSGTGKTRSLIDMDWDKTFVIRPNKKPFSFPSGGKLKKRSKKKGVRGNWYYAKDYNTVFALLPKLVEDGFKSIVIDDSTHLLMGEFMDRTDEKGFNKWEDMAKHYYDLIKFSESLPDDVVVYIVNHIEVDNNGNYKIKTIGKLLDEKVDIPSYLTIALISEKTADGYKFRTQNIGSDFAKSPEGMFPEMHIDNDLSVVDKTIREYYGLDEIEEEEE